jgi:hypothetical protein
VTQHVRHQGVGRDVKKAAEKKNLFPAAPYQMLSHNVLEHASNSDNSRSLVEYKFTYWISTCGGISPKTVCIVNSVL